MITKSKAREIINELNEILAKCYDSEKGYKEAVEEVENVSLKAMFEEYAKQRNNFGDQIKREIQISGGEVEEGDTILAKAHRVWMDIRSLFAANDESAILKEAIRGEKNAIKNYDDAIAGIPVTSTAYTTLVNQRNQIGSTLQRLEELLPVYQS